MRQRGTRGLPWARQHLCTRRSYLSWRRWRAGDREKTVSLGTFWWWENRERAQHTGPGTRQFPHDPSSPSHHLLITSSDPVWLWRLAADLVTPLRRTAYPASSSTQRRAGRTASTATHAA